MKKRLKLTATGKVRHRRANTGHLMSGKSGDRCRRLRRPAILNSGVCRRIREALAAS
jgi:large subunit ribosomal protein L35